MSVNKNLKEKYRQQKEEQMKKNMNNAEAIKEIKQNAIDKKRKLMVS